MKYMITNLFVQLFAIKGLHFNQRIGVKLHLILPIDARNF